MGRSASISVPTPGVRAATREWLLVPLFCLLTAVLAQIKVPVPGTPVPMTLQTVAVILTGLCLSPRPALVAMLAYVVLAAAGFGVLYAGSAGLALTSLTGGYLIGFVFASPIVSLLVSRSGSAIRLTVAAAVGTMVVLCFGAAWLVAVYPRVGIVEAIGSGVAPFLVGGAIKTGLAVALVLSIRSGRRLTRPASESRAV